MHVDQTVTQGLNVLQSILPWLIVLLGSVTAAGVVSVVVLNILDRRRQLRKKYVHIELTPPAQTDKSPEANQRLFAVLHGLEDSRTPLEKLLRRKVALSFEVVSTREQGIRYIVRVAEDEAAILEETINAHSPDAKLRRVDDFLPNTLDYRRARIIEVKQTGHFAYPLHTQFTHLEHDPMAYLTGAMTKLAPGELMSLQIVLSPVKSRAASALSRRLIHNEELLYKLGKRQMPIIGIIFNIFNNVTFALLDGIGEMVSGVPNHHNSAEQTHHNQVAAKLKPARVLSPLEQKLAESVQEKLNQPLFRANIRALVLVDGKEDEKRRAKSVRDWLTSFNVPKYQALRVRFSFPASLRGRYRRFTFQNRLPAIFGRGACLLSTAEVADLYHFPNNATTKTENIVKSLSKTLPAPLSLKRGTPLDVVLGRNHHHGTVTDVGLTADERERHMFVVGGTGNGKTTLLKYAIVQDIKIGKGVAVLDPHGDLAQELLALIPEERINDVIYFNPADLAYPIGMNLLEVPEGLTGDQLLEAQDFIAEMVVSIMRKTFSDDGSGGHRIEYVLRNAVLTALTVKDATIFTVYDLLTDKDFRKPIVKKLEQKWLRNFWNHEFGKAGDYQQVKMMSGVTSKIGRYHASVSAERALEQPKSTINFGEVLDGKILICNLAKGSIGEDTSEVLGISVLAQLQLASYRRINQKRAQRQPFYAYVDEFQNFATVSFVEMLSEARKYKLFLIMAEQTTAQQDDENMVNTLLTNAGTIVCFKSNSLADEKQMLHLFNGKVDPGEISNLPAYNFYAKLSGGTDPQDPVSGMTIVLDEQGDEEIAEAVIAASRKNYAKKYVAKTKKDTEKKAAESSEPVPENNEDDNSEQLLSGSEA